jgi:hypothetical protein
VEKVKMAKYCGYVGYASESEIATDVWAETITEKKVYGDVLRNYRKLQHGADVNPSIDISNEFSIIADAYARDHFFSMRYITWMGAKWKITSAEPLYPRIIIQVGGLWNENET